MRVITRSILIGGAGESLRHPAVYIVRATNQSLTAFTVVVLMSQRVAASQTHPRRDLGDFFLKIQHIFKATFVCGLCNSKINKKTSASRWRLSASFSLTLKCFSLNYTNMNWMNIMRWRWMNWGREVFKWLAFRHMVTLCGLDERLTSVCIHQSGG